MSLESISQAKALAAKGRHGDSVMVHMSPDEVMGLQAIAKANGASLSINPYTGMPEAFSLKRILPTIVGTAVGAMTGNPWLGAAVAGGLGYASTGNLMSGLTAAAGAYGGAGLVGGAQAAGVASAAPVSTVSTAVPSAASAGTALGTGAMSNIAASPLVAAPSAAAASPLLGASNIANVPLVTSMAPPATATGLGALQQAGTGVSNIFSGDPAARTAFMDSVGGTKGLLTKGAMAASPLMFTEPTRTKLPQSSPDMIRPFEYVPVNVSGQDPYSLGSTGERLQYSGTYRALEPYTASEAYKKKYPFAGGGIVALQEGGEVEGDFEGQGVPVGPGAARTLRNISMVQGLAGLPAIDVSQLPVAAGSQAPVGLVPRAIPSTMEQMYQTYMPRAEDSSTYKAEQDAAKRTRSPGGMFGPFGGLFGFNDNPVVGYTSSGDPIYQNQPQSSPFGFGFNQGGEVADSGMLPVGVGYAKGRFLQGPGDGTSDSIPATIADNQPARLADGEFVVDARTVSEIGNGSSKAGAKKLYAMMDRVHNARKKAKRGQDSKAERFMPA